MAQDTGLELSILDSAVPNVVIVLARSGSDLAVSTVALDEKWAALVAFRDRLDQSLRGNAKRPTAADVVAFGHALLAFLTQGDVGVLVAAVQTDQVRHKLTVTVFSNQTKVQEMPWEYLQEPDKPAAQWERAVVRVLPTIGLKPPEPIQAGTGVRLLFVYADPVSQTMVSWPNVQASLERAFREKAPDTLTLRVVEGQSQAALSGALRTPCDVFHFCGHGEVREGVGGLILTGTPDFLPANTLAGMLSGTDVRLAILSACETSAGSRRDQFGVVADALIRAGIPAVVANQLPVSNSSIASFTGALYTELLRCGDIDRAVTLGRRALAYEQNSTDSEIGIEWGIPTLHRLVGGAKVYAR
jgi:hypothetical protein